ncbi:MAG: penicillin acylase family protein [Acidobacteria bacterium]|nr:penicillin acylase family protein [Acidobacteriota bacterium]
MMTYQGWFRSATAVALAGGLLVAPAAPRARQQPTPIELDAATLAARTDAARAIIPLLGDVKRRVEPGVQAQTGTGSPTSPFTGTPTTVFSVTLSKRPPADPQVVQAMDRLLKWEPGNRSAEYEAALFDRWFERLSSRASAQGTQRGLVSCDAGCVARTMTSLDGTWGKTDAERAEARDEVLLETLAEAVKTKE